jgi:(1->4)-alpha-D-glucan 1-alpha-D-glucosylmutase
MNDIHALPVKTMHSSRVPTLQHEYLLYQTLVGAWPLEPMDTPEAREDFRERIQSYMLKATREAKDATAWLEPDPDYEHGLARFIDALLEHGREPSAATDPGFLDDLHAFVDDIAPFGACNGVGMAVLKLTSPGVPDIYQGCETWNLSLVDPDNRRHIDFTALSRRLDAVEAAFGGAAALPAEALAELRGSWKDGRLKMLVVSRVLALRRARAELFRDGRYTRLQAHGPARGHVVAYARELEGSDGCVVIAGRLMRRLTEGDARKLHGGLVWKDTHVVLPQDASMAASWRDAITGRIVPAHRAGPGRQASIALSDALSGLTAAVLVPA